jgi:ATP-dependent RNA helicase DeaD
MRVSDVEETLGAAIVGALKTRGYDELTPVQQAVLAPALRDRDLRITSQTGSGKTLAIGFALRRHVEGLTAPHKPRALVLAPTRELAQQTQAELSWLYAGLGVRVALTTGGSGYRDELRALQRSPALIVGTPGRLLDHLGRGSIDASELSAVVLDEADRMLDLGFRDDIEAIFARAPKERRTHLVTATFPRQLRALADAAQRDPAHVEGSRLGAGNADIDHVLHLIAPRTGIDALVNLLLAEPDAQTLIFARMRVSVAKIAAALSEAGFDAATLSGELDQAARNRALAAFRAKSLRVLVATDVAARGIDVQDIARVIHADPPSDADSYTHRAGRTGRAGRKGVSSLLVTPADVVTVTRLLRNAGLPHRFEPIPSAQRIRKLADARMLERLTRDASDSEASSADGDPRLGALADALLQSAAPARAVARLIAHSRLLGVTEPRAILQPELPRQQPQPARARERQRPDRAPNHQRERTDHAPGRVYTRPDRPQGGERPLRRNDRERSGVEGKPEQGFTRFHVSWGRRHGAEPHRVLALVCRRGGVRGHDVGAIRIEAAYSLVEVADRVAVKFAAGATKPDPQEPRVRIELFATEKSRKSATR